MEPAALHPRRVIHLLDAAAAWTSTLSCRERRPLGGGAVLVRIRPRRAPAAIRSPALEERPSPIPAVAKPPAGRASRRPHRVVPDQRRDGLRERVDMGVEHPATLLEPGTPVLSVGVPAIGHSGISLASGLASEPLLHRLHGNPHSPAPVLLRRLQRSPHARVHAASPAALLVLRRDAHRKRKERICAEGSISTGHRLHGRNAVHRIHYRLRRVGARHGRRRTVPVRAVSPHILRRPVTEGAERKHRLPHPKRAAVSVGRGRADPPRKRSLGCQLRIRYLPQRE